MQTVRPTQIDEWCNRLFLEEFENLNAEDPVVAADQKLKYSEETSGQRGFQQDKIYDLDKL